MRRLRPSRLKRWAGWLWGSRWNALVVIGALAFLFLGLEALLAPEPAAACNWANPTCWAEKTTRFLFGVDADWITGTTVQWLINIESPGLTGDGVGADLYKTTRDLGFGALGAALTLSTIHYWAAGFPSMGGAGIALDGMLRTAGAALFILSWPWMIDSASTLAGIIKDDLIPGAQLDAINAALVASLFGPGTAVFGIVFGFAYGLLFVVLISYKVILSAALLAIAGGMPLALAIWAIPGLAFFANGMLKWCAVIVAVPIAWSVEVYLFGRIPENVITLQGGESFVTKVAAPITMLALLFLMVITPNSIMRLGGMGGGGNFLAFMTARLASGAIGRHLPERFGGTAETVRNRQAQGVAQQGQGLAGQAGVLAGQAQRVANHGQAAAQRGQQAVQWGQQHGNQLDQQLNQAAAQQAAGAQHVVNHGQAAAANIAGRGGGAAGGGAAGGGGGGPAGGGGPGRGGPPTPPPGGVAPGGAAPGPPGGAGQALAGAGLYAQQPGGPGGAGPVPVAQPGGGAGGAGGGPAGSGIRFGGDGIPHARGQGDGALAPAYQAMNEVAGDVPRAPDAVGGSIARTPNVSDLHQQFDTLHATGIGGMQPTLNYLSAHSGWDGERAVRGRMADAWHASANDGQPQAVQDAWIAIGAAGPNIREWAASTWQAPASPQPQAGPATTGGGSGTSGGSP